MSKIILFLVAAFILAGSVASANAFDIQLPPPLSNMTGSQLAANSTNMPSPPPAGGRDTSNAAEFFSGAVGGVTGMLTFGLVSVDGYGHWGGAAVNFYRRRDTGSAIEVLFTIITAVSGGSLAVWYDNNIFKYIVTSAFFGSALGGLCNAIYQDGVPGEHTVTALGGFIPVVGPFVSNGIRYGYGYNVTAYDWGQASGSSGVQSSMIGMGWGKAIFQKCRVRPLPEQSRLLSTVREESIASGSPGGAESSNPNQVLEINNGEGGLASQERSIYIADLPKLLQIVSDNSDSRSQKRDSLSGAIKLVSRLGENVPFDPTLAARVKKLRALLADPQAKLYEPGSNKFSPEIRDTLNLLRQAARKS